MASVQMEMRQRKQLRNIKWGFDIITQINGADVPG